MKIKIDDISDDLIYYYERIGIFAIIAKSKLDGKWYCIRIKILMLKNNYSIKASYLSSKINNNFLKFFYIEEPSLNFETIYKELQQGKIKLKDQYYDIYLLDKLSDMIYLADINDYDKYIQDCPCYIIYGTSSQGFFENIIKKLNLSESDLGIDKNKCHYLLNVPSNDIFIQHSVSIIFPLFIKEIENKEPSIRKTYEVSDSLIKASDLNLYTDDEDLTNNLRKQKIGNNYIIEIPFLDKNSEIYFEFSHSKFGKIIEKTFPKNENNTTMDKKDRFNDTNSFMMTSNGDDIESQLSPFGNTYIIGSHFESKSIVGDNFQNITESNIIKNAIVQNAFNKVEGEYDSGTKDALEDFAKFIEKSGNYAAQSLFKNFSEEIVEPKPDKSKLKSIFEGIKTILPDIVTISSSLAKITQIFSP